MPNKYQCLISVKTCIRNTNKPKINIANKLKYAKGSRREYCSPA